MIAHRGRGSKRGRILKMSRNIERMYKEGKCRDCSVVVTRMDFAKILGKFTKVKIQYECSSPKTKKTPQTTKSEAQTPVSNARLKNNENGMVLLHRKPYNLHPVKDAVTKKVPNNRVNSPPIKQVATNILREVNISKNGIPLKDKNSNYNRHVHSNGKQYAIIFNDPTTNHSNINFKCDLTLAHLLPKVDKNILPSNDWCIDYFPKRDEPQNDKVYDRIAAELEDLMYNKKPEVKFIKPESTENKTDDFPSIMDILNDNIAADTNSEPKNQTSNVVFKDNLESSDVEAILLGKVNNIKVESDMEVDNTDVTKLIDDVVQYSTNNESVKKELQETTDIENPHSPSILDEALQKGIEEHLPSMQTAVENTTEIEQVNKEANLSEKSKDAINNDKCKETTSQNNISCLNIPSSLKMENVTHVIFKKVIDGKCMKSVMCPRNLNYSIELEEKSVEFLGAPKYISSLEDLQVLLQIVNETELKSLYVLY